MKQKIQYLSASVSLCLALFGLSSPATADHQYKHIVTSLATNQSAANTQSQKNPTADSCSLDILNYTYESIDVAGRFEDGSWVSFTIYPRDKANISLYYYSACHPRMLLQMRTTSGRQLFNQERNFANATIMLLPTQQKHIEVQVKNH